LFDFGRIGDRVLWVVWGDQFYLNVKIRVALLSTSQ
jgi:hypothetical protein